MRRGFAVAALAVGVVIVYAAGVALTGPDPAQPSDTPDPGTRSARIDTTASTTIPAEPAPTATTTTTTSTTTTSEAQARTYLVWSPGGLPSTLADGLTARFPKASVVAGGVVELDAGDGAVIPLDALALDPARHRPFDPDGTLAPLQPGTVALGATSADLRDVSVGDVLPIAGTAFELVAVVPDETVAAAEVVFHRDEASVAVDTERFALVATHQTRTQFEAAVRGLYDGPAPLRIRTDGEAPWMRHGDAVLPQVFIKEALGEFSYTHRSGSQFEQERAFRESRIVTTDVPLVGDVVCHRAVTEMLTGAMDRLDDEGLGHLVDPAGFAGCWNPRFTRTVTGTSAGLSRHAWGAAVDINAPTNPFGSEGSQDPRLVAVMEEWGFTWGGNWLIPDPMHFEYGVAPSG